MNPRAAATIPANEAPRARVRTPSATKMPNWIPNEAFMSLRPKFSRPLKRELRRLLCCPTFDFANHLANAFVIEKRGSAGLKCLIEEFGGHA
jgi:hypothetical protein